RRIGTSRTATSSTSGKSAGCSTGPADRRTAERIGRRELARGSMRAAGGLRHRPTIASGAIQTLGFPKGLNRGTGQSRSVRGGGATDRRRPAPRGVALPPHPAGSKPASGSGAGERWTMQIKRDFIGLIGNTPLMRLKRASAETGCEILGKCEFLNPGGSIKDRAALAIIEDAEAKGLLRPGGIIVEGTAGNTGIGLALVGNAKGYRS